jgi:hypothetical protein
MITIEATKEKKVVDSLCLTDPYDGGSRERNHERSEKWKEEVKRNHGEVEFAYYMD